MKHVRLSLCYVATCIIISVVGSSCGSGVALVNFTFVVPVEQTFPPCTDEDIDACEKAIGYSFPEDYRDFLKQCNGFEVVDKAMMFMPKDGWGEEDMGRLYRMYGISASGDNLDDVRKAQRAYHFNERVPDGMLAIGEQTVPAMVCISLVAPDRGTIYSWSPGLAFEDGPNEKTRDYLHPVAKSFSAFWKKLKPLEGE